MRPPIRIIRRRALPRATRRSSIRQINFSIAVPSSWTAVNPTGPGATAAIQQVEQNNPDLQATLGSLSNLVAKGVKYFAVYNNGEADQLASVNVVVEPDLGFHDSQLAQLAAQLSAQLAKVGATVLGSSDVSLDGYQALRVALDLPLTNAAGNRVMVGETQYYLGSSEFLYVITLSGNSSDFSAIASTFKIK